MSGPFMTRDTDIFLALFGVAIFGWGLFAVIKRKIGVGFRWTEKRYLLERKAQIYGAVHVLIGTIMAVSAFLSWINFTSISRDSLLAIWLIALLALIVITIIGNMWGLIAGARDASLK